MSSATSVDIDPELKDEVQELLSRGFFASWMGHLRVGDIFAGPRLFSFDGPRKLFVVDSIYDERGHNVINVIVYDEDDVQRHLSYGVTNEIFIWRG